jgi:hypothetical protein
MGPITALLLAMAACGPGAGLGPGDRVGQVRLVRGAAEDVTLWDFCDPELPEPGRLERACRVPPLERLRIGPGWRAGSASELEREWEELEWRVTLDGRPLDLEAFGTLPDTTLSDQGVVREWNVTAQDLGEGTHRLRARIARGEGSFDVTWVIEVGA